MPDLRALVEALNQPGLRWVLVGGLALALHGGSYPTMDADVAFAPDWENVDLLVEALAPLHPRPIRVAADANYIWDRLSTVGSWVRLTSDAGEVDLIRKLQGVESFDRLYERAIVQEVDGVEFRIASLDDLIAMKSQSSRAKDKLHLLELQALKKLQNES